MKIIVAIEEIKIAYPLFEVRYLGEYKNHSFSFPIWEVKPFPALPLILRRKDTGYPPYIFAGHLGGTASEKLNYFSIYTISLST